LALALAAALVASTVLAACGSDQDEGERTLTVYAAASLADTFEQIGQEFEAQHDGVRVELGSGGSADLVAQIQEGAPADVFASADLATMEKLTAQGLEGGEPRVFATNTLEIVVAPGNPLGIASLADVADAGVTLVTCAPVVPCGAAAQKAAESAGVDLAPVSEEQSVADVLAKVTSGEADAGLVYVTDVLGADGAVDGVDFPEASAAVNRYPIATLADSEVSDLAADFVDLVLGDAGQALLREAGFGEP
ncbi:molybdate ABC transporter substrate-binding protein, partial [Nocardioides sp.]|uniref:molybdate ABC transporter substrate-binding protein n=1 Tax=Nocardioides sp. TaxID=35761 RepID=UPI0034482472